MFSLSDLALALQRLKLPTLTERQERLDDMLTQFNDVRDTIYSGGIGKGDGGGPSMTDVWKHGSFPILEQLLKLLRRAGRAELDGVLTRTRYWHLAEWYLRSYRVLTPKLREVSRKGIRRQEPVMVAGVAQMVCVYRRHDEVDVGKVRDAVVWVEQAWPRDGRQPSTVVDTLARLEKARRQRALAA